jgi:hypothetical protein
VRFNSNPKILNVGKIWFKIHFFTQKQWIGKRSNFLVAGEEGDGGSKIT